METNEAAAALLNMESPNNILDEKRMSKLFCIFTPQVQSDIVLILSTKLFLMVY